METVNEMHELKTWPEYFKKVKSGEKKFEVRNNDRNFKVGDTLLLKEWQPIGYSSVSPNQLEGGYTGEEIKVKVTYILQVKPDEAAKFGLSSGTCVMSIDCDEWQQPQPINNDMHSIRTGEQPKASLDGIENITFDPFIESMADKMMSRYDPRGTFKTWEGNYIPTYDQDTVREMLCNFVEEIVAQQPKADAGRWVSFDDVGNIALELRNAALYANSHNSTRFELQDALSKIYTKYNLWSHQENTASPDNA